MFYKFYDRGSTTAPGVMGPATLFLQGLYKKKKYILVSVARRKTPKRPKRADKKWRYLPFPFIHTYLLCEMKEVWPPKLVLSKYWLWSCLNRYQWNIHLFMDRVANLPSLNFLFEIYIYIYIIYSPGGYCCQAG